jgi:transposase
LRLARSGHGVAAKILARVDRVLNLSWLRAEVRHLYAVDGAGRPGIDPEAAVRLMLAGFLLGIVHDRRLLREAQVNIAIRGFAGYGLHEILPDHWSLTRIRQRWGAELFRRIFTRMARACVKARIAKGEVAHIDATLIRADVAWECLGERHVDTVLAQDEETATPTARQRTERDGKQTGRYKKVCLTPRWQRMPGTGDWSPPTSSTRPWTTRSASSSTWRSRPARPTRATAFWRRSTRLLSRRACLWWL